jgi:uncharacterized protein YhfF
VTDLETLKRRFPDADAFARGDGPVLCQHLTALIRSGAKTATTGAAGDFATGDVDGGDLGGLGAMPKFGRRAIVLNWDGTPALVIETQEVVQCRFSEVTQAMALAEGEDDLAGWCTGHAAFFERNGGFSPDMTVVWEKFRLVQDLA